MMYYLNNGNIINNMESLQGNVTDDVYEAMEGLHNEEVNEVKKDMQYYKYEKEHYELRFDDAKSQLYNAQRVIEELKDYIKDSKRVNRNTILEYVLELQNTIENGIDA
ncbi:MAG: hypothetical protein ACLS90_00375 [Clostridia bacterium]